MSKRRKIKSFVMGMMGAAALSAFCVSNVNADEVSLECDETIVSCYSVGEQNDTKAVKLVWYYKEINGKKYRRLYDATNKVWLTDWILC